MIVCDDVWVPVVDGDAVVVVDTEVLPVRDGRAVGVLLSVQVGGVCVVVGLRETVGVKDGEGTSV